MKNMIFVDIPVGGTMFRNLLALWRSSGSPGVYPATPNSAREQVNS